MVQAGQHVTVKPGNELHAAGLRSGVVVDAKPNRKKELYREQQAAGISRRQAKAMARESRGMGMVIVAFDACEVKDGDTLKNIPHGYKLPIPEMFLAAEAGDRLARVGPDAAQSSAHVHG